jgi:CubicO group peptidase (beta-lactamase class C family)
VALVAAMLVDRGLLDYDEKISKYWPEFAKNGKDNIRLCDVLRHESGLSSFNFMHNDHDILRENIKTNSIGAVVESCNQYFPNSINDVHTERAYHGITRGFILNEIVRRVDPKGR